MALQPVLPTIIGEGRSARVSKPSLNMPDIYGGLTRGLRDAAGFARDTFRQAAAAEVRAKQEKESLLLEQAMAEYDEEVSFKLQDQVFSLSGESAAGAGELARKISHEAWERQQEKLSGASPQVVEKFRLFVQKDSTSRGPRVMAYEQAQLRSARVSMNGKLLSSRTRAYAETGEPWYLEGIEESFQAMTENSGQRVITPEKMEVFNSLYDKGEIVLQGEKLKIVDGPATEPGTISRSHADDLRSRLRKDMEWYAAELQSQFDAAHSARVDAYLANGQIAAAASYLDAVTQPEARRGMSREAREVAMGKVSRHQEVQAVQITGQVLADHTLAAGIRYDASLGNTSLDGRYWTPAREQARLNAERDMMAAMKEADPETRPKLDRALNMYRQQISQEKALRQEYEKADILSLTEQFRDSGLFDPYRIQDFSNEVAKMPDSPVKAHFQNMVTRLQIEQQEAVRGTPEYKKFQEARLAEFKRHMSAGEPLTLDGVDYDLTDSNQLSAAVRASGFGPEAVVQIMAYASTKRVPYHRAAGILAETLNELNGYEPDPDKGKVYFDQYNVTAVAPELLTELENIAAMNPDIDMDTKEGAKWMKDTLRGIILNTKRSKPGITGAKAVSLHHWLGQAVTKSGELRDDREGRRDYATFLHQLATTVEQKRGEMDYRDMVRRASLGQPASWQRVPAGAAEAELEREGSVKTKYKLDEVYLPREEVERRAMEKRKKEKERELKSGKAGEPGLSGNFWFNILRALGAK
jgi:hypothetical protein